MTRGLVGVKFKILSLLDLRSDCRERDRLAEGHLQTEVCPVRMLDPARGMGLATEGRADGRGRRRRPGSDVKNRSKGTCETKQVRVR